MLLCLKLLRKFLSKKKNIKEIRNMKMKIEILVERWNDERPQGFIAMSEKQKKEEFKKFCDWNGFDLTNLTDLFIEYDV